MAGTIVLALGDRSLRTAELAERTHGYAARTVYRHTRRLVDLGVIEREEGQGVPSKVVYRITDPCGVEFRKLIEAFASTSLNRPLNGEVVPHSWGLVTLMADLWEAEMVKALNDGPCTPTMLARANGKFSVHQVRRRITLFLNEGLIRYAPYPGQAPNYELTDRARRIMGLIAGIGRWRERHLLAGSGHGLTASETADLLAVAVPLARVRRHQGKRFVLAILPADPTDRDGAVVSVEVRRDGAVAASEDLLGSIGSWGKGAVSDWLDLAIDGRKGRGLQFKGPDAAAVETTLKAMHTALWKPETG